MTMNDLSRRLHEIYVRLHFTRDQRLGFYESLYVMLKNKMPLKTAFGAVRDIHVTVKPRALVNHIFHNVWGQLHEGHSFADCMAPWVPDGEYLMIRAGHDGGDLVAVLETVLKVQRRLNVLVSQVLSAMAMPAIYLVVLVGMSVLVADYVVPWIEKFLPHMGKAGDDDSGGIAQLSVFLHRWLPPAIIFFIGLITAMIWSFSRVTGPLRRLLDKLPGYNLYRAFVGAEFLLTLSGYLKQNVPIRDALERIKLASSGYRAWHLDQMLLALSAGSEVGEAFRTGLFSSELEIKFMSYARHMQATDFSQMMETVAEDSVAEVSAKTLRFAKAFSSASKAIMLLALAWLAMVVMSSVYASLSGVTGVS
jgi:type II secretory pathway component PulF